MRGDSSVVPARGIGGDLGGPVYVLGRSEVLQGILTDIRVDYNGADRYGSSHHGGIELNLTIRLVGSCMLNDRPVYGEQRGQPVAPPAESAPPRPVRRSRVIEEP